MSCRFLRWAALATAQGILALPAPAQEGRVDQIERAEVEAGETEMELRTIHVSPAGGEMAIWAANFTLEHGISSFLALGIEVETGVEDGDDPEAQSIGLQAKWVADPERVTRFGVQSGLFVTPENGRIGSETFLIAQTRQAGLDLVANAVIETEPGAWQDVNAAYGLRADYPAGNGVMLGLESGGGLSGEGAGAHWLGPVLSFLPDEDAGRPAVELSLFLPLTEDTPDVQIRVELDRAF